MTPIPFDLPKPTITPMVAYATGLVCEQRPDLADEVRCVVLGNNAVAVLDTMMFACVKADDGRGISALTLLRSIVRCEGKMNVFPILADLANVVYDSFDWHPSLDSEHADLALQLMYWRLGFGPCWEHAKTPNDLRGLRRLIVLHAHTVSLGTDLRASWAKAHLHHLDTLEPTP
jgi:hypothetical protein